MTDAIGLSYSALILSMSGALAAATLGGFAYLLRQWQERKRLARRVLFNLLNIWEILISLTDTPNEWLSEFLDIYKEVVRSRFGAATADSINWDDIDLKGVIAPLVMQAMVQNRSSVDDSLRSTYRQNIELLSERHPMLAFRLSGRERITDTFRIVDEYEASTLESLKIKELSIGERFIRLGQQRTRVLLTDDLRNDFEADIRAVAYVAGIANWVKCALLFRRARRKTRLNEADRGTIRHLIQDLLSDYIKGLEKKTDASEG